MRRVLRALEVFVFFSLTLLIYLLFLVTQVSALPQNFFHRVLFYCFFTSVLIKKLFLAVTLVTIIFRIQLWLSSKLADIYCYILFIIYYVSWIYFAYISNEKPLHFSFATRFSPPFRKLRAMISSLRKKTLHSVKITSSTTIQYRNFIFLNSVLFPNHRIQLILSHFILSVQQIWQLITRTTKPWIRETYQGGTQTRDFSFGRRELYPAAAEVGDVILTKCLLT